MRVIDQFLVFSDLHAHSFKYGAKQVNHPRFTGVHNSRLLDSVNVIDHIRDYAVQKGIKTVLFGGDLFHRRSIQKTDAYNLAVHELYRMADEGIEICMIPGNHDYADRLGTTHALQAIRHNSIYICDDVTWLLVGKTTVFTVPYTDDLVEARARLQEAGKFASMLKGPKVLLAHLGMQGATVGSDYVLVADTDISVSDVPQKEFDLCLFGHFHQHQRLFGNGWCIGATHEHNWGDTGGKRGFLHAKVYEDNSITFEHIEIPNTPKFLSGESMEEISGARDVDFVRLFIRDDQDHPGELDDFADFQVVLRVDKPESRLILSTDQLNPERALDAWVEEHGHKTLSKAELLVKGQEILRKAKGG